MGDPGSNSTRHVVRGLGPFAGSSPAAVGGEARRHRASAARSISVLSFGLVANLVPLMTFAATLHEIAVAWSLSAAQSGWIGGIYFAGYAVAVPVLASATDRIDGRRLIS